MPKKNNEKSVAVVLEEVTSILNDIRNERLKDLTLPNHEWWGFSLMN